jgi:hypothetical protein
MFGNAWAVFEEYPSSRYGMDGATFWPYIRVALSKENPDLLEAINDHKFLIDLTTHLAFVMLVVGVEAVVLAVVRLQAAMLLVAAPSLILYWVLYQAAITATRTMGRLVALSFDLYRLPLLDAFDLERPANLDEEFWVWTRLGSFIRRGEPFYFDLSPRKPREG